MSGGALDFAVVIPARLKSSRLPKKPLADIGGKPMIQHTYERALEAAPAGKVFIATDSHKIADICTAFDAQTVMTSDQCLTGTDRVAEFAKTIDARTYINLQGDEPFMPVGNISALIEAGLRSPDEIINGWAWIDDESDYRSVNVPKVVVREDGRLMYMSRSPIPGNKVGAFMFSRRQVCVYAFPKTALAAFEARGKKTEHESAEDIEILRFVEMGFDVQMIELDNAFISVDTPEDLEKVRAQL